MGGPPGGSPLAAHALTPSLALCHSAPRSHPRGELARRPMPPTAQRHGRRGEEFTYRPRFPGLLSARRLEPGQRPKAVWPSRHPLLAGGEAAVDSPREEQPRREAGLRGSCLVIAGCEGGHGLSGKTVFAGAGKSLHVNTWGEAQPLHSGRGGPGRVLPPPRPCFPKLSWKPRPHPPS